MRWVRNVVMLPVFLLVLACSGEDRAEALGRGSPAAVTDNLYGLEGLREACAKVPGARFREHKKECECSSLQFKDEPGQVFSTIEGGSCSSLGRPVPLTSERCSGEGAFKEAYLANGIDGLNGCLRNLLNFRSTHFGIQLSKDMLAKDALKIARRLDNDGGKLFAKLWPTAEPYFFNSSVLMLTGPVKIDERFIRSVLQPPNLYEKGRYQTTFVEPDPNVVFESLGHPLDPPRPLAPIPDRVRQDAPWLDYAARIYESVTSDNLSREDLAVGGDCRKHCSILLELGSSPEYGMRAVREKRYLWGAPYRDVVRFLSTKSGELLGLMQLNLRGSFSTLLLIHRFIDQDRLLSRVRVFDRRWNNLGEITFSLLEGVSEKENLIGSLSYVSAREPSGIVLCEAVDLKGFEDEGLLNTLRRSVEAGTTLFGWMNNPGDSIARWVSPLIELSEGALPVAGSASHGVSVARVLYQRPIIPISMPSCLKEFSLWSPLTRAKAIRVVNFSGSYPVDSAWCQRDFPVRDIFSDQARELWVTAAGNSGVRNPTDRCPQSLGVRKNLIVVAGGTSRGLWRDSDYGSSYADIAADPKSETEGEGPGTSFSAPRVADVAAQLSARFPELPVQTIRLALLAGASVPAYPLEVRSGGALNSNDAHWFAEQFSANRALTWDRLFELWSQRWGETEGDRRVELWRSRGLSP